MREVGKGDVPTATKLMVAQFLNQHSINGKPQHGKMKEISIQLGICTRSVRRIWSAAKTQMTAGEVISFKNNRQTDHPLRRKVFDIEQLKAIPFKQRSTYRRIAREMGVSKTLVAVWVKRELIRAHTNAIKPLLTSKNRLQRLQYCLSTLEYERVHNRIKFESMHNTNHIDEKWFFITKATCRTYLASGEKEPYRSCKSKSFITKLMFMCAVARPLYDVNGVCIFDGKIGVFLLTFIKAAKRNSKNRPKGTLETKPIAFINKDVTRECLISQIIPAIKSKWPETASKTIYIQQDNARPHIQNSDEDFQAVAKSDGFNIQIVCQPANSPDTNINDLGWFRAIQSLQDETSSYTVEDLIKNVKLSYDNLDHKTSNNVFLSLQGCLIEIMKSFGHNGYKLPHMNNAKHIREGTLPKMLEVEEDVVRGVIDFLKLPENAIPFDFNVDRLLEDLGY